MSSIMNIKGARRMTTPTVPKTNLTVENINASVNEVKKEVKKEVKEVKKEIKEKPTRIKVHLETPSTIEEDSIMDRMYKKAGTIIISGYDKPPCNNFNEMNLPKEILNAIFTILKWELPSPIQAYGINPVVDGRDLLCQAQTGTGKTATFLIAGLQKIDNTIRHPQIIVLTPSRELSIQIFNVAKELTQLSDITIAGHIGSSPEKDDRGVNYMHNVKPDNELGYYSVPHYSEQLIIATPGRLCMLLNRNIINTENIKLVILDEADKMLSDGFRSNIVSVFSKAPKNVQVALYSATVSPDVKDIAGQIMNDPVSILVPNENVVLDNQNQYCHKVRTEDEKKEFIKTLFESCVIGQTIIFCNRKFKATNLKEYIDQIGITVACIHSDMEQSERNEAMENFRTEKIKVLIGTDVIARGIDTTVHLVINYDIPSNVDEYIHRIGRTGRFGKEGSVINIVSDEADMAIKRICSYYSIRKMSPIEHFFTKGTISKAIK